MPEETSLWINGNQMQIIGQKPAEIFDGQSKVVIEPDENLLSLWFFNLYTFEIYKICYFHTCKV